MNYKEKFYEDFKNGMLCTKFCSKRSRQFCCPELSGLLCVPKRKLLEEMIKCDDDLGTVGEYDWDQDTIKEKIS